MNIPDHDNRRTWLRNAGFAVGVTVAHVLVFALILRAQPSTPMALPLPPMLVELVRPEAPPPPPPPPEPAADDPGGGAPAAPSRIHTPPPPRTPPPPELLEAPQGSAELVEGAADDPAAAAVAGGVHADGVEDPITDADQSRSAVRICDNPRRSLPSPC